MAGDRRSWRGCWDLFCLGSIILIVSALSIGSNTRLDAQPRFDGAGYAILAKSLAEGRGYREIHQPLEARHAHFPPGYPIVLALIWRFTGPSLVVAHGASIIFTMTATLAAWLWFRRIYSDRVAFLLGIALASNWAWGRIGGVILSEPIYLLLGQMTILLTSRLGSQDRTRSALTLGILSACCVLTRHVGVCLVFAVSLDLLLRGRWKTALLAGLVATACVLPWLAWLATIRDGTQVGLLSTESLAIRVARQSLFYFQRLPDQWVGPIVEVGTVFRRSIGLLIVVNLWGILLAGLLVLGWWRILRSRQRRLAALVPLATLPVLVVWPFTEAGRFLIPLVPCLLVGWAEGFSGLGRLVRIRNPRCWGAFVVLGVSLPYASYASATGRAEGQRRTYHDFDEACAWIVHQGDRPGLVLSSRPGEVYWQTGRQGMTPASDDPGEVSKLMTRYEVAYLLIGTDNYEDAPVDSLSRYLERHPERLRSVWARQSGPSSVQLFEVVPLEPHGLQPPNR